MKKFICVTVCLLLVSGVLLLGFGGFGSNVKNAVTRDVPSEIYSEEDIEAAIKTIKTEFAFHWRGCELLEIYYAGDEMTAECQEWAERYDADEAIVLKSTFKVNKRDSAATLNEGATYDWWNWILVRGDGGRWRHVDHGFI